MWGLTFTDAEINVFRSGTSAKPQGGKATGGGSFLLPSVAPISRVPFTWLKHHSASWVSAPIPESDTRRHFRLDSSQLLLKGQQERTAPCHPCISKRRLAQTRYHPVREETVESPGGWWVCTPGARRESRLCLLHPTAGPVRAGAIGAHRSPAPGSVLEQRQRACRHTLCD